MEPRYAEASPVWRVSWNVTPVTSDVVVDNGSVSMVTLGNETVWNYSDYSCRMLGNTEAVRSAHKVYLFASLFFITVGLVGNALSVLVFSSKDMRVVSSNVYLLALSFSDSLYLVSVFFTKTINTLRCFFFMHSTFDPSNTNDFMCKSLQFMQDLFSNYSTCLILAFTLERYIAVYLPIKFKDICTVIRSRISCIAIFLVITIFISPYHYMYMKRFAEYNVCAINWAYEETFSILYVVEMLLFRIIPVFIIVTLNVFIIIKVSLVTAENKRKRSLRTPSLASGMERPKPKRTKKEDKSLQLTVMLVLVSTSYVLVLIPVLIHFILQKLQLNQIITFAQEPMDVAQEYTRALYISGFAINFFLYTMSGRVFREQLERILCHNYRRQRKEYTMSRNGYTGMATTHETDV